MLFKTKTYYIIVLLIDGGIREKIFNQIGRSVSFWQQRKLTLIFRDRWYSSNIYETMTNYNVQIFETLRGC